MSLREPLQQPRAFFRVPNAKRGVAYAATVEARREQGTVSVMSAVPPEGLGLRYDPGTQCLEGVPQQAGEYAIPVHWRDEAGHTFINDLMLIVNADPRDLWKNMDPDPGAPYFKPNEDKRCLEASGRRLAAASKRGRSHAHIGSFRDDDFYIAHDAATGWSVLLVADGAGSAPSSRRGAALAAQHAGGHLSGALASEEGTALRHLTDTCALDAATGARPLKDALYQLFSQAAWSAVHHIEDEAAGQGAQVRDYATTLLCAVHCNTPHGVFVASFWLGDGAICAYGPQGHAQLLGRPDSGEFAGQTVFLDRAILSDASAVRERIEFHLQPDLTALMLMTDGISDPHFETDRALMDAGNWQRLWSELAPCLASADPAQALLDWMDFFTPGHHDDRTLALWW